MPVMQSVEGVECIAAPTFVKTPLHADQDLDLFSSDMEPRLIAVEIDKLHIQLAGPSLGRTRREWLELGPASIYVSSTMDRTLFGV
ncbi:hypothetical protein BDN72DRAFT_178549 [Pluteus cervinus]|uniref:Uncharacterized protein n=1 Tax=Pluteus cervinus TaxID=181527 RepID=A0ACD2ZWM4_9AGAR|nr:hypothetical protein BDN72DRAFT_178549 [Pluteus cervinus]